MDGTEVGAENHQGGVLDDDHETDRQEHLGRRRRRQDPADEQALDRVADSEDDDEGNQRPEQRIEAEVVPDEPGDVHAEHQELGMGEIDHTEDAEDE